ncbi:hypothetical protein MPL3356_350031 [Mesorhizobium plurifarium]|uniref:Uncharacterized protein n=1 Tax=Mesorhizobium plurifarium TaxID=69974 RepID=A0A090E2G5_MESPL|nr:hypothetical protein MPL3356_350031 [Mesorhizobium plurifarium]
MDGAVYVRENYEGQPPDPDNTDRGDMVQCLTRLARCYRCYARVYCTSGAPMSARGQEHHDGESLANSPQAQRV